MQPDPAVRPASAGLRRREYELDDESAVLARCSDKGDTAIIRKRRDAFACALEGVFDVADQEGVLSELTCGWCWVSESVPRTFLMRWPLSEGLASICGWVSKDPTSNLEGAFSCFTFILERAFIFMGLTSGQRISGKPQTS